MTTWLVTSRHVSSPCILAVSSLSNSTARHARFEALDTLNVSCRDMTSQGEFGLIGDQAFLVYNTLFEDSTDLVFLSLNYYHQYYIFLFLLIDKFLLLQAVLLMFQGVCMNNAIWGLVQTEHSDLDFDFWRYVSLWLEQYSTWKEKFLSLAMP